MKQAIQGVDELARALRALAVPAQQESSADAITRIQL
ncbi:MAG: hypothetical protein RLZZ488_103 [Pseudomonadota bacterium]|jgi:hypothetical protein